MPGTYIRAGIYRIISNEVDVELDFIAGNIKTHSHFHFSIPVLTMTGIIEKWTAAD